jgi:hypothetical protein
LATKERTTDIEIDILRRQGRKKRDKHNGKQSNKERYRKRKEGDIKRETERRG